MEPLPVKIDVRVSRRARYMRLSCASAQSVILTIPFGLDTALVDRFLAAKAGWLTRTLEYLRQWEVVNPAGSRTEYLKDREQAREVITQRVRHFAAQYGLAFGRISIRNQKSRWGSCSKDGNLNFNYRLLRLPAAVRDYVVVHELCHLKCFNHSPAFWALVSQACPDYNALRKQLRHKRRDL